jgi:hypothetical protein
MLTLVVYTVKSRNSYLRAELGNVYVNMITKKITDPNGVMLVEITIRFPGVWKMARL